MTEKTNPSHYKNHKVSPIDLIESYDLNFNLGNSVKYIARHKEKDGRTDLIKALWYLLNELGLPRSEVTKITSKLEAKCSSLNNVNQNTRR